MIAENNFRKRRCENSRLLSIILYGYTAPRRAEHYETYPSDTTITGPIPLFVEPVSAGFPSVASDYVDEFIDLNTHLIKHPSATYFLRVTGSSMVEARIHEGDLVIVDSSLEAKEGIL